MLILLPPSEGKAAPRRGKPLDLAALSSPSLTPARETVLDALVALCTGDEEEAVRTLGLGVTQADEVRRDAALRTAPTARADQVYAGVLYEALDLATLSAAAKRRAGTRLGIASGLFGLVRAGDRIPAYRLSGQVTLPGVGAMATFWGRHLAPAVEEAAGDGLVLDLRSGGYAPFWRPTKAQAARVVTARVLHEFDGRRTVVSHFNKATKGRLVRALLEDGANPRTPEALATVLGDLGWTVELAQPVTGKPRALDVVVSAL